MVKNPKNTEVLMYGETGRASQRAEIISFDKDGKANVQQGGVARAPIPAARPQPRPQAAPQPRPAPTAPAAAPQPAAPARPGRAPVPQTQALQPAKPIPAIKNPADAKEHSQALAISTVGSFVDQLRETAQAKGGVLSLRDIDAMQSELVEKTRVMEAQFEAAFVQYADARESLKWGKEREDPFFRVLVKQFSPLFKERVSRKTVTRRMLPGFFMAVGMLLGPDVVDAHHARCRGIIARMKSDAGDEPFDWDAFYVERDAVTVSLDAQILIAARFKQYDRRMEWFINLVNSHLAPVVPGMSEAEQKWELAEQGFRRMMDAMLADLRKVLSSEKGRERLIKRHGRDNVGDAIVVLKRLLTG